MIFNQDLLFLHLPKTGGVSARTFLLRELPGPVYYFQEAPDPGAPHHAIFVAGGQHLNVTHARDALARFGRSLESFQAIVAAVRDPYEWAVSEYTFSQFHAGRTVRKEILTTLSALQGLPALTDDEIDAWAATQMEKFQAALDLDFEQYVATDFVDTSHVERFLTLDGSLPANLRIIHTEDLERELVKVLNDVGIFPNSDFPRMNTTPHHDYRSYFTPRAEALVYEKYRWLFDRGLYQRRNFPDDATADGSGGGADDEMRGDLPVSGPVCVVGDVTGLFRDSWVAPELSFPVSVSESTVTVEIVGAVPSFAVPLELSIQAGGKRSTVRVERAGPFEVEAPLVLAPSDHVPISIGASPVWSRSARGGRDRRQLSFYLTHVRFHKGPVFYGPVRTFGEPVVMGDPATGSASAWQSVRVEEPVSSIAVDALVAPGAPRAAVSVACGDQAREMVVDVASRSARTRAEMPLDPESYVIVKVEVTPLWPDGAEDDPGNATSALDGDVDHPATLIKSVSLSGRGEPV